MADLHALCKELVDIVTAHCNPDDFAVSDCAAVLARARAALAQPEPVGLPPRVRHILRLAEIIREVDGNHDKGATALAEAILSHPGSLWQPALAQPEPEGRSAIQPEPEVVGPSDEELLDMWAGQYGFMGRHLPTMSFPEFRHATRAILTSYAHPTPQPIPVSERLPEAGDCDAEGRCWFWGEQLSDSDDEDWGWKLLDRTYGINWSGGPWLPAHALPLPTTTTNTP